MHCEVQRKVRMLSTAVLAAASLSWPINGLGFSYGRSATHKDSDQGSLRAYIELMPAALLAENLCSALLTES